MNDLTNTKLTDKQRKKLLADRVDGASLRALAKKYKVSVTTVRRIISSDSDVVQKVTQKKEENTQEILEYMESKKNIVCNLIELYIDELMDRDKLKKATIQQIATSLAIVIDKFTGHAKEDGENAELGIIEIPSAKDGMIQNE